MKILHNLKPLYTQLLSIASQDVLLTFIPSSPGGPCEEKLLKPNTEGYREQH